VAGYKPRWFTRPQTVTHPSTNRARRRVPSLIETNALPPSQAVCLSAPRHIPTLLHRPRCNLCNGRGWPLVVYYLADLQLVHGFRCPENIHLCKLIALRTANAYNAGHEMSASACTQSVLVMIIIRSHRSQYCVCRCSLLLETE